MWNSPHSRSEKGRRYRLEEISALVLPLDELLDAMSFRSVSDLIDEPILRRLEKDEFIFALYEVLQALLEEVPVPEGGHVGIHEAMIAELLNQAHGSVVCEMDAYKLDFADMEMAEPVFYAREAVWTSVDRLLIREELAEPSLPSILEDAGMKLSDSKPHLSEKMTPDLWEELLLGDDFLLSAFVEDTDWRMEFLMDAHPAQAKAVSQMVGLDLDVVQALPHTPSADEKEIAERYIRNVRQRNEAMRQDATKG